MLGKRLYMTATRSRPRSRRLSAVVVTAVGAFIVVVLVALAMQLFDVSLRNPFAETTKENPNAVVLAELRDQSRFSAASGRFQTLIDSEQDANFLPDAIKGSRSLFIAEGDVEAYTEFGGLTEGAVQVSPDGKSLTVHVPPAQLGPPRLDPAATRLVSRERGVLDRLGDAFGGGDPTNQQALNLRAEQKIAEAAQRSDLAKRAEENTEKFLRGLFAGMGYQDIRIVFDGPRATDK
jgi:hypothetical protein